MTFVDELVLFLLGLPEEKQRSFMETVRNCIKECQTILDDG